MSSGMTNYRIGSIGPKFDHSYLVKEGQWYGTTVSWYEYWANDNW